MSEKFLGKKPREIRFCYQGQLINPEEIFNLFYKGLEQLVETNIRASKKNHKHRSLAAPVFDNYKNTKEAEESEKIVKQWIRYFPKEKVTAQITFDNNSKRRFTLRKRTNFNASILKLPSVIYLHGEDGSRAILREARTYSIDDVIAKIACRKFGIDFDPKTSRQFQANDNETKVSLPQRKDNIIYIPEPQLLVALEQLYNSNFPKITPEIFVVSSLDNKLWYIRDLLPTLVNTEFDFEKLGRYFGAMHSLGLMDSIDRQIIHYCTIKGHLVNFDPDIIMHTRKLSTLTQKDFDDLVEKLQEEKDKYNLHVFDEEIRKLRKASEETRIKLETDCFNQETIFDYLSRKVDPEKIKDKKIELI